MTLNFNLSTKKGDGYQLNMVVRHRGLVIYRFTGFTLRKEDWDKKKQRVKVTHEKSSVINNYISSRIQRMDSYIDDCVRSFKEPKASEAVEIINGSTASHTAKSLSEAFEMYMAKIASTHDEMTVRRYKVMRDNILDYQEKRKRRVLFDDVGEDFYLDFIKYCINERDNHNRTIRRKITFIKTVMRYAVKKKAFSGHDWDVSIELNEVDSCKVPLTHEERQAIWDYKTTDMFERRVIDAFIFGMYTGLRYGDLQQLAAVHFSHNGTEHYIDMSLEKGNKSHLVGVPQFIMDRFGHYLNNKGPIFRLTENIVSNRIIRRMATDLEFNRKFEWRELQGGKMIKEVVTLKDKLSFHFARYTYTRMLDDSGIQATWVQKNLRHAKFATTERYLKADDMMRIQETNKKLAI